MNVLRVSLIVISIAWASGAGAAPRPGPCPAASVDSAVAPTRVRIHGELTTPTGDPRTGTVLLVVSLYAEVDDSTPLWFEQQLVTLDDAGRYTIFAGATENDGLPQEFLLAGTGSRRWLGVGVQGEAEQFRMMIVGVPYALKAQEADTLAGKTSTDFVLAQGLGATVKSALTAGAVSVPLADKAADADTLAGKTSTDFVLTQGLSDSIESALTAAGLNVVGMAPGTQPQTNALAKFSSSNGTVVNSAITEISGNVGVGTNTPSVRLDITGHTKISGNFLFSVAGSSDVGSSAVPAATVWTRSLSAGASYNLSIKTPALSQIFFGTNGTDWLGINSAGTLYPIADNARSLGGFSNRWSGIYAGPANISQIGRLWIGPYAAAPTDFRDYPNDEQNSFRWLYKDDGAGNREYIRFYYAQGGVPGLNILVDADGSGRKMAGGIGTRGDQPFDILLNNGYRWTWQDSSGFYDLIPGASDNYSSLGRDIGSRLKNVALGEQLSVRQDLHNTNVPAIQSSSIWNNPAVTFTHINANITDTDSAADSKFLDFQIAGTTKLSVQKDGTVYTAGNINVGNGGSPTVYGGLTLPPAGQKYFVCVDETGRLLSQPSPCQ